MLLAIEESRNHKLIPEVNTFAARTVRMNIGIWHHLATP